MALVYLSLFFFGFQPGNCFAAPIPSRANFFNSTYDWQRSSSTSCPIQFTLDLPLHFIPFTETSKIPFHYSDLKICPVRMFLFLLICFSRDGDPTIILRTSSLLIVYLRNLLQIERCGTYFFHYPQYLALASLKKHGPSAFSLIPI